MEAPRNLVELKFKKLLFNRLAFRLSITYEYGMFPVGLLEQAA
jgi:hypothetical protein